MMQTLNQHATMLNLQLYPNIFFFKSGHFYFYSAFYNTDCLKSSFTVITGK